MLWTHPLNKSALGLSNWRFRNKTLMHSWGGGEPTIRDDLPEIVFEAKKAGCNIIQLNSNGVRLANDMKYVKATWQKPVSPLYLCNLTEQQMDIYEKLCYQSLLNLNNKLLKSVNTQYRCYPCATVMFRCKYSQYRRYSWL